MAPRPARFPGARTTDENPTWNQTMTLPFQRHSFQSEGSSSDFQTITGPCGCRMSQGQGAGCGRSGWGRGLSRVAGPQPSAPGSTCFLSCERGREVGCSLPSRQRPAPSCLSGCAGIDPRRMTVMVEKTCFPFTRGLKGFSVPGLGPSALRLRASGQSLGPSFSPWQGKLRWRPLSGEPARDPVNAPWPPVPSVSSSRRGTCRPGWQGQAPLPKVPGVLCRPSVAAPLHLISGEGAPR